MTSLTYLVAYTYNQGRDLARIDLTVPVLIKSLTEVELIEAELRRSTGYPDAFVLSFSLYTNAATLTALIGAHR